MNSIESISEKFELENLLADNEKELILLKVSPYCPISHSVESNFDRWAENLENDPELDIRKVNVISARNLSNYVAEKFQIRHESPQLIWFTKTGKIKWHESHYGISTEQLNENLKVNEM
ncbi:MAG: bacillithiol system redox-active protein YtxJ [Melioribacteraceae bacterium]|nr:bacillithiol system redox-active protein YtxJ [Melioribacteraceae bacterium]